MPTRRPRYSGSLYRRGPVFQIQYFVDGVRFRESAKTTSKDEAAKLLAKRLAEVRAGESSKIKKTTVESIAELYLAGQRARWKPATVKWTSIIVKKHIVPAFGDRNPASLLLGDLDKFIAQKKDEKLSEPRINRFLVILKAILQYAVKNKVLREIPEFPPMFNELPHVRHGHIDEADWTFISLMIPDNEPWLRGMMTAAYTFGFRLGELTFMRVKQIDLERHTIILPAGSTKNSMERRVIMNPEGALTKLLADAVKNKPPDAYVFSRDERGSAPVRNFRVSWDRLIAACKIRTGSGKNGALLFHDLRRSAITRMADAGLSEHESMAVAGHLSSAVHRRYKQISDWNARKIAAKIDV
jgi:integrase